VSAHVRPFIGALVALSLSACGTDQTIAAASAKFEADRAAWIARALSLFNGASWFFSDGESEKSIKPGPHFATMRQIAWEVGRVLERILEVADAR
jgi:hypothetical protein